MEQTDSRFDRVQHDIENANALTLRSNEIGIGLYADNLPIIMVAHFEETEAI